MKCTRITTTAVGTPIFITEWAGDHHFILGMTPGMILGSTGVITVLGPTVAGTHHGTTGMAAGTA